jgi:hypothetical protein
MFSRCLFCHASLPENGEVAQLPHGRGVAFDPEQGRLWVICARCGGWNLAPIEDRHAALHELERLARDRGRAMGGTANVMLLDAGPLWLLRIGRAGLGERAAWRYGAELRRRKSALESTRARITAYTLGAMHLVGEAVGLSDPDLTIDWRDAPVADVQRWRRFGWAAWHGRQTCPWCLSTLRALRYDLAWWVYPLRGRDGRLGVGVPCQRCDPWTPEKAYELHGDVAENVLRRLLAYVNIQGASERRLADAVRGIEELGSAGAYALDATEGRRSLWRLGATGTIGLEIALNESAERRLLDMEAHALEFLWKREDELARIIDEELTPKRLLEAHLRRLPIKLRQRLDLAEVEQG